MTLFQRNTPIKAITLTQPWATLMAVGEKRIETRSWSTNYRGPLAIHAAKGFPESAEDICEDEPFSSTLTYAGYPYRDNVQQNPRLLPTGKIVAVGYLQQVELITQDYAATMMERAFGNYAPGRYAWRFSLIYRLPEPIEARGSLGLWTWNPPLTFWDELQTQLGTVLSEPGEKR